MRKLCHLLTGILLLVSLGSHAQTTPISGKVTDPTGAPIPGATIKIKGLKGGTSAGSDGSFSLTVPTNAELFISAVGYETREVKANSGHLTIQLNADSKSLSEVVVTGVGTATSKKKLGIAVQSVSADKLPAAPTASIDQALIGKIPGAQISSISGNPGDPVNIVLRGINTLQNGTKPLIMVDGIQVSATDINSLDLTNVDRVEVVQGAASASLYGAQGANGAIQIFTKKGKKGNAAINYSTSYASNSYLNIGNVHKAQLHPYLTDANNNLTDASGNILGYNPVTGLLTGVISYTYGGATRYGILNPSNINDKPYNANLHYYDQFKEIFQTGSTLNNAISISGGSDKSDYAISVANNHTISPVLKNGYVDRSNLTANLGTEIFKGFKLRSITQLVYTRNTLKPGLGGAGGYFYGKGNSVGNVGSIYGFMNTSPFFSEKYQLSGGGYANYREVGNFLSVNESNPYYQNEFTSGLDNKIDIIQNFDADYKVNKFIELDAKYGINYRTENSRWTYFNQTQNGNAAYWFNKEGATQAGYFNGNDLTGEVDNWQYGTTFQNFLGSMYIKTDWQNDFHSKLPITTSTQISFDYRKNKYSEYDTYGEGLSTAPPYSISATQSQAVYLDYVEPFITYGYLVNQIIDIGDFGGVTGGFRSDYSSAFGQGSQAFTFPHANAYFLPSSLNFWKNGKLDDIIPSFKLRSAYGEAGIQPGPFDRYPVLNQSNLGSSLVYSLPTTSQNGKLNVEVSKEFEAGTDLVFNTNPGSKWFNTINVSATYWTRKSDNVIFNLTTAPSSGATGELNNVINMSSKGFEFQISIPVVQSKNFSWTFTDNFGHQTTMIDKISGGQDIPVGSVDNTGATQEILSAGHKIGQIYGYKTLRSVNDLEPDGKTPYISAADAGNYEVVNGTLVNKTTRGIYFASIATPFGDPNPKFNTSFINELTYKNFLTLNFQFDWVYGSHLYNQTKEWMYRDGISGDFAKPVLMDGTKAAYTSYWASAYYGLGTTASGSGNDATKDFFYESSSFLRLRNVALALDFAKIIKLPYFKKLQLVMTGRNIWTKTKYSGFDPEINSSTNQSPGSTQTAANSAYVRGIDGNTIPNIKSYQIGLNVGF